MTTKASEERVRDFVDEFIRSAYVTNWIESNDSDFINYPDRAERCYEAAEYGADGKTHAEVINDWRAAFRNWLRYDRPGNKNDVDRFEAAVEKYWDNLELWHEANGSLWEELG